MKLSSRNRRRKLEQKIHDELVAMEARLLR